MIAPQGQGLTASTYRSYLVRLWRSHPHAALRASAQCVQTGAVSHFNDLAGLFVFLESLNTLPTAPEPTEP